jgi:phospholipid/cholesterol/gamma-HCH transport system permease protein
VSSAPPVAELKVDPADGGRATLRLSGSWRTEGPPPDDAMPDRLVGVREVVVEAPDLDGWGSALLAYVWRIERQVAATGGKLRDEGLPAGIRRLLMLARAGVRSPPDAGTTGPGGILARIGTRSIAVVAAGGEALGFLGEVVQATGSLLRGRARMRGRDLALAIEDTGVRALPIISLISLLVGVILAFIGAAQLSQFGAEIFVANLVAIGMLREMGALMAGVLMAGRTGAAYAAELGTMQVNEEIDALQTMGVPPIDFLVLPRVLALVLMLPLLAIYADLVGIIGGALMGVAVFGIDPTAYLDQTLRYLTVRAAMVGIVKAVVFAIVVSLAGCYHGIHADRSSAAVGMATTRAVVSGIVLIVVTDAIMTVLFNAIGF